MKPKNDLEDWRKFVEKIENANKELKIGVVGKYVAHGKSEHRDVYISILEAMGLGKTVITTPVGGIPEFCFNNRNGLYVERNPRDIAEKILYLYKNPKLIERFFKNNIEDTKKFDWNRIVDQYISLYRSVIN